MMVSAVHNYCMFSVSLSNHIVGSHTTHPFSCFVVKQIFGLFNWRHCYPTHTTNSVSIWMSAESSFGVEFFTKEFLIFNSWFYLFTVHVVPKLLYHSPFTPSTHLLSTLFGLRGNFDQPPPLPTRSPRGKMSQYVTLAHPPSRDLAYVSSGGWISRKAFSQILAA